MSDKKNPNPEKKSPNPQNSPSSATPPVPGKAPQNVPVQNVKADTASKAADPVKEPVKTDNPKPDGTSHAAQGKTPSEPVKAAAKAENGKPDHIATAASAAVQGKASPEPAKPVTPPPAKPAHTPPPVTRASEAKAEGGKGLALIALAVSVAALALGGYQFLQNSKLTSQLNDQRAVLQKEASRLDAANSANTEQLAALRSDVAAIQLPAPGMDRDSVVKTIAENIAKVEKSVADMQASAVNELDKRLSALPKAMDRTAVQSLVKQELATFAQTLGGDQPTLDFSDEIAKVEASEARSKQILADIEKNAAQLDSRLQQALADAEKQLAELADSRASVLNLVTLAQLAGHAGQYQAAAQYLQQAGAHLAAGDNAQWQGTLADAAQRFQQLASQPSPHAAIDQLLARVGEWPLRNSDTGNLIAPDDAAAAPTTLMDKVRHVGHEIIAHTVTVVPLDDEGLAWVNHNPALQNIIRQNVRLDLAFARNALQMQDSAAYAGIAATLKAQMERYFDTGNAEVKGALETLARLESAQQTLPDLAPVIQALRNGQ
ncbi:MAG: uroporphyrinogen-III C-methyltransferase [Cardiobacteriaceae bacterium]|nr:uroporphyrinogen-III C-methyltransferase [Cardiobacteriaceae bacterium]